MSVTPCRTEVLSLFTEGAGSAEVCEAPGHLWHRGGTVSEMLPLAPRDWREMVGFSKEKSQMWVPSFLKCQSPYPSSLSIAWKSWCCCPASAGQLIPKMGLSLGWTCQLSSVSRTQGILSWFSGIICCPLNRAQFPSFFSCICHFKLIDKEICPYFSIMLVQKTFVLWFCSSILPILCLTSSGSVLPSFQQYTFFQN